MSLDKTVSELRNEIADLRRGLFISVTVVMIFLMLANLFAISSIPRMNAIFEDLLGSRDKLPRMARLTLAYGKASNGYLAYAVVISFTAIGWSLMSLNRHSSRFLAIAIVAIIMLSLHYLLFKVAVGLPLAQIIQGISGAP